MKRYLVIAIVAVALAAAILLALPLLKKDEPTEPAPDCLTRFMQAWSINFVDDMLSPCSPAWRAAQSNPEYTMFALAANRTPVAWAVGNPTKDGDALVYPVDVLLRKNNILQDSWQRFQLRVVTENEKQYVIPDGIASGETVKAPKTYVTP